MIRQRFLIIFLSTLSLLCVVLGQAVHHAPTARLQLIHADLLQGQKSGDIRELVGNVKFQQGLAVLTCDRAVQYVEEGRTILVGNVAFVDTSTSLFADQVLYHELSRMSEAEGHVRLVDSSKTLNAERLIYQSDEEKALATGKVRLEDAKERVIIEGESAEYHRRVGEARITGHPVLTQTDTTDGKELIIHGAVFEMFKDGDEFQVIDSVQVIRGELAAFCDTLVYDKKANSIKLAHAPRVYQNRQYLAGEAVTLFLHQNDVEAIKISGNAIASSHVDSTLQTSTPYDLLSGEEMMVYVRDEKIDSVQITGRATSFYHVFENGQEKGLNKVLGDTLFITFVNEDLDHVRVCSSPGSSKGEFYPPRLRTTVEAELRMNLQKLGIEIDNGVETGSAERNNGQTNTEK